MGILMAKVYLFLRCYLMSYPLSGVRTKVERRTFSNVRILINCGSFRMLGAQPAVGAGDKRENP